MSIEPQGSHNKSALNPNVVLVCVTVLILAIVFFFKSGTSKTVSPAPSSQTVGQQGLLDTITGKITPAETSEQAASLGSSSRSSSFLKRHPHISIEELLVVFDVAHLTIDSREGRVLSLLSQGKVDEAKKLAERENLSGPQMATIFGAAGRWNIGAELLGRGLEYSEDSHYKGGTMVKRAVCLLHLGKTEEADRLLKDARAYAEKTEDSVAKQYVSNTLAEAYSEYITLFPDSRRSELLAEAASLYDKIIAEFESYSSDRKQIAVFYKAHKGWVSFLQGKTLEGRQALEQYFKEVALLKNSTNDTRMHDNLEEISLIHRSRLARIYETLGEEASAKRLASEVDLGVDKIYRKIERMIQ